MTIVSREIIKPSFPTPSHKKTYNLTSLDQIITSDFVLMVAFYPNTSNYGSSHDKTLNMKKSLSETLTKYYPFAGRYAKVAPTYVDCNDNGAQFFEASIDRTLSYLLQNSAHEDLDQLFPHGLVNSKSNGGDHDPQSDKMIPLAVQVSHFECGGLALAVSLSHKVADGSSLAHFMSDWAELTKICSSEHQKHQLSIDPVFIPFEFTNINFLGLSIDRSINCVTRSFTFPNSKITNLKRKVTAMTVESGQPITNPTRVEVLSWLFYKCAVAAAAPGSKNDSGSFKPTSIYHMINLRGAMMEPLPEKSIRNLIMILEILTMNEREMKPESYISEFRKQKMQVKGLPNVEVAFDLLSKIDLEEVQRKQNGSYFCTSLCGFPFYEIDFGWGKPVKVTFPGFAVKNSIMLIDDPNRDAIEGTVCLGEEDMAIFQSDPELRAFIS